MTRDAVAKGARGTTLVRIGWRSGAWSELAVDRPGSSDYRTTPAPVLERIRTLAQGMADDRIAAALNAEGLTTYAGLAWTGPRVEHLRHYHGIPTTCPLLPQGPQARGDGLIPVATAAVRLGAAPGVLPHWCRWGFLHAEQQGKGSPLWLRLTEDDVARLDGTLAARGAGQWRLREARQVLGLSVRNSRSNCDRSGWWHIGHGSVSTGNGASACPIYGRRPPHLPRLRLSAPSPPRRSTHPTQGQETTFKESRLRMH